jgi:hypothetical protein
LARAVIWIDVPYVLVILGRRIAIIGWCDLVRSGISGVAGFTAPIVRTLRRSRSAISAQFVHRHALTDEPCQLGKRIVSRRTRLLLRAAPTARIAIGTLIVFSHEIRLVQPRIRLVQPRTEKTKPRNIRTAFAAYNF